MKNLNLLFKLIVQRKARWLLTFIAILTLGVGQMKAYDAHFSLMGDPLANDWANDRYYMINTGTGTTDEWFIYAYVAKNQYFALNNGSSQYGPSSNGSAQKSGSGGGQGTYNSNSWKFTGTSGIVKICCAESSNREWYPYVWVDESAPTIKFKHPWNGGSWSEQTATKQSDGTYRFKGQYGGTAGFNAGYSGNFKYNESATTVTGSPTSGDYCYFIWNPVGYVRGTEDCDNGHTQSEHCGTFTIVKLCGLTYDGNGRTGGTAVPSALSDQKYGSSVTLSSAAMTKTGYTLTGWNTAADGSGTHYALGASFTFSSKTNTLYAEWTQTLALNQNGATTDGTTSVTATFNGGITSISSNPSKTDYDFQGYYPNQNGTGSCVINTSKTLQTNVTDWTDADGNWIHEGSSELYAKWTQTVTLNSNYGHGGASGGNGGVTATFNGGLSSISHATAESPSYALEGYYTGATDGDKVIDASGNIVSSVTNWTDGSGHWIHASASTLYAHWKTTYTLSYNANGATADVPDDSEETMGSTVTAASALERDGYTFTGWNEKADGSGDLSVAAGGTFPISKNTTLYAQWSENTVTLTPTKSYTGTSSTHSVTGGGTVGITTTATLTAAAAGAGYIWNGWSLSSNLVITSGTTSSLTITVRTNGDGEAVSAVAQYTEDLSSPFVLKGGSKFGGTAWSTEHALTKKAGFSGESVAYFTIDLSTTNTGASNSNYQFKIFKGSTAYGLTGSGQYYYERTTGEQELSSPGINIELRADKVGAYEIKVDYSSTPYKITITFPGKAIVGTFNSWNTETNQLVDGVTAITLAASSNYQFKVFDGGIWYGNSGTMTATNKDDWEFTGGGGNCTLTTTTAGLYIFGWNTTTKRLTVIFPNEQSKMKLDAQQYLYFDATGLTGWNSATFDARFWIKNYASGEDMQHVDCVNGSKLDGNVYYVQLPNNDNIGQIQINRLNPATSEAWNTANKNYAYKRADIYQNCLVKQAGKEGSYDNWTPQWSTYCPPISTASMSPTSTTYGGDGSKDDPYLVPVSSTINVSTSFTQPLNDTKMTQMYQFKADNTNDGGESSTSTHSYTASSTSGTKKGYTVTVRNNYNSTNGTAATSSTVYFETRASYTITYNAGANGSGSISSGTKLNGIDFTLSSLVFSRTDYLQIGWATSDGGDKVYELGDTYTTDANLTLYPYWILKDYTVTLNPDNGGSNVEVTATYNSAMPSKNRSGGDLFAPTYAGYTFDGYFTEQNGGGTQYYDEEMASARNWDIAAATTLYAYWIPNTLTFNGNVSGHETEWNNTGNWSEACVPTINHPVVIDKPVVINTTGAAKAKSVVIYNDGGEEHTGKLEIPDGKALIVAETIQKTSDGETMGATAEADIVTGSSLTNGNGVLIMGTYTGGNEATVGFVTKSHGAKGENTSVNQFIGTPFAVDGQTIILYNYYNSWMCKVDYTGSPAWALMSSDEKMNPFEGYNLISAEASEGTYYGLTGKLVSTANQTLTLKGTSGTENLLANSWMGPILISKFLSTDFVNADAVIYIFNAGSPYQMSGDPISSAANYNSSPGQYTSIPINLVSFYTGYKTIPSMQAFSVMTNGSSASLTLDYKRLVYDPAVESVLIEPNHAPRRTMEENNAPEMMNLYVSGESGYSDRVWMVVREDFSDDYENGWEARKIFGADEAPQFYAMSQAGEMAIDAVAQIEGTVLAFRKGTQDSNYTFSFSYDGEDVWYLNDLQEQQSTLINANNTYTFMSAADDNVARFIISATPINRIPTATDQITLQTEAKKMLIDGTLYIIRNGRMYSAEGQIVK